MQTYDITISEDQRQLIVAALRSPSNTIFDHLTSEKLDEWEMLLGLFDELPEQERKEPKILHGFCY